MSKIQFLLVTFPPTNIDPAMTWGLEDYFPLKKWTILKVFAKLGNGYIQTYSIISHDSRTPYPIEHD